MQLLILVTGLLSLNRVVALRDAGSLLIYSTERAVWPSLQSQQLSLSGNIESALRNEPCPAGDFIVVSQQLLDVSHGQHMRAMQRTIQEHLNGTTIQIPQILGTFNSRIIERWLGEQCFSSKIEKHVLNVGKNEADKATAMADMTLDAILMKKSKPYTLLFVRGRHVAEWDHEPYTMDESFSPIQHADLRRGEGQVNIPDADQVLLARESNGSDEELPLFETYQFLSPAIFMGLGVTALLLSILYIALSAISGLEVSYKAFAKETASQTQKAR